MTICCIILNRLRNENLFFKANGKKLLFTSSPITKEEELCFKLRLLNPRSTQNSHCVLAMLYRSLQSIRHASENSYIANDHSLFGSHMRSKDDNSLNKLYHKFKLVAQF